MPNDNEKILNAHLKDQIFEDRLETLILRGETSPFRLGMVFDIPETEMVNHIKKIFKKWRERRIENIEEIREHRIEQINYIMRLALKEYDESKKPLTKYTEERTPCFICNGKGKDEVHPGEFVSCKKCSGRGHFKKVKEETIQRNANPNYLKIAKECVDAAAKLAGIGQSVSFNMLNKLGQTVDGEVKEEIEMLTFQGATENIIGAIAAMDLIKQGIRKGNVKKIDPSVSKPDNDNTTDDTTKG